MKSIVHPSRKNQALSARTLVFSSAVVALACLSAIGCTSRKQYAINEAILIGERRQLEDEIYRAKFELRDALRENEQLRRELSGKQDSTSSIPQTSSSRYSGVDAFQTNGTRVAPSYGNALDPDRYDSSPTQNAETLPDFVPRPTSSQKLTRSNATKANAQRNQVARNNPANANAQRNQVARNNPANANAQRNQVARNNAANANAQRNQVARNNAANANAQRNQVARNNPTNANAQGSKETMGPQMQNIALASATSPAKKQFGVSRPIALDKVQGSSSRVSPANYEALPTTNSTERVVEQEESSEAPGFVGSSESEIDDWTPVGAN